MNEPTTAATVKPRKLTIDVAQINNPCFNDDASMGDIDLRDVAWCATSVAEWTAVEGAASGIGGVNCYLYINGEACICQDDGFDVTVEPNLRIALVASVLAAMAAS